MNRIFAAISVGLLLTSCGGASSDDACLNIKDACKDDQDISQQFNMGNCVEYFDAAADGREDERDCVADAESCQEIIDCNSGYFD